MGKDFKPTKDQLVEKQAMERQTELAKVSRERAMFEATLGTTIRVYTFDMSLKAGHEQLTAKRFFIVFSEPMKCEDVIRRIQNAFRELATKE